MINARQKDTVIGHISVYKVDKLIEDRKEELGQTDLPAAYTKATLLRLY